MMYFTDVTEELSKMMCDIPTKINLLSSQYSHLLMYYRVVSDFRIPLGLYSSVRVGETKEGTLSLKVGDIIKVCSMTYLDSDHYPRITNLCLFNDRIEPIKMNKDFFEINPVIFEDITIQMQRDSKLTKILNQ